jgi:predicted Zn finger-like uncharacterized protein
MRITCPSCAADYEVPPSRLTPRKVVRCARCGGEWIPVHTDEDADPRPEPVDPPSLDAIAASLPAVTAMDRLAASPPVLPASRALFGAWVLSVVVLLGAVIATVTWRDVIMQAWPPSALLLAPFGHIAAEPAQTMGKKTG